MNVLPNYSILHENEADKPLIASKDEFCLKEYALAVLQPTDHVDDVPKEYQYDFSQLWV